MDRAAGALHESLAGINGTANVTVLDEASRIRMDDWELRDEVQSIVKEIWPQVTNENIFEITVVIKMNF